jgi:hypothetical protein
MGDKKYNMAMRRCKMPRTGRPKSEKPLDQKISIRFTQEEYSILVEYAQNHNMAVTQVIRLCLQENILKRQ